LSASFFLSKMSRICLILRRRGGRARIRMVRARACQPVWEEAMDVGLIGLGRMGAGIAKSLLRAGHRVTVFNRTRERAEALRKDGAAIASSVADACQSDAVLTMLADDAAVEAVVFGESGVLKSLPRGRVHISLST